MMDILFYVFVSVFSILTVEGRLIHKNKTKASEVIQTENPNPTIRLTRDIDNEQSPLTGLSNEEAESEELIQTYNTIHRVVLQPYPKYDRMGRESNVKKHKNAPKTMPKAPNHRITHEHLKALIQYPAPKFNVDYYENGLQLITNNNHKVKSVTSRVLVKKPIPKFSDTDYEDDFQTKMNKARSIIVDSGDHEDEDFNLGDYEFDVNHDEFLSGRKPLEPRINLKTTDNLALRPELKMQAKIADPRDHRSIKREGNRPLFPKPFIDYNEETTTTETTNKSHESENDEYSDEGDDSKETKKAQVRSIRSWDIGNYKHQNSGKNPRFSTKTLTVLPMFPQVPKNRNVN